MEPEFSESEALKELYSLGSFSGSPLVGPQCESDLPALVFAKGKAADANKLIGSHVCHREHVSPTWRNCGRFDGRSYDLLYLFRCLRLEAQVPCRVRIAVDLSERPGGVRRELPQDHGRGY
jgi:hypothetical protein